MPVVPLTERLRERAYHSRKEARRHDEALAICALAFKSDFTEWRDRAEKDADLDAEAADRIALLEGALRNAVAMAKALSAGYANPNINHEAYRTQAAIWADDFLEDDAQALAETEAPND